MNFKRIFFTIVVLLIVLAFAVSFFSAGIISLKGDAEENVDADDPQAGDDTVSPFIQSIQSSMVESENKSDNANNIAKAINVYNALIKSDSEKIISFDGSKTDFGGIKAKLNNMGIYFEEITASNEKDAWEMIKVDENGVAVFE